MFIKWKFFMAFYKLKMSTGDQRDAVMKKTENFLFNLEKNHIGNIKYIIINTYIEKEKLKNDLHE